VKTLLIKTFLFFLLFNTIVFSQWETRYSSEFDITPYLKKIESGQKLDVLVQIPDLKKRYPNDPSIKYLAGILEDDSNKALAIFRGIVEFSPKSKFADAAAFRAYSYYYSIGVYDKARSYSQKLKKDYPSSPYLKLVKKNIPKHNEPITESKQSNTETVSQSNSYKSPQSEKDSTLINNGNYLYQIQAGAFSKEENAVSLNKNFKDAGYDSEITQKNVGGTIFHIVVVGKFKTEDEAHSFLDLVNSKYSLDGRIIPFDK